MNNIKEKYEFLKHFEKNNPILPEVKIKRFLNRFFISHKYSFYSFKNDSFTIWIKYFCCYFFLFFL